MNTLILTGGQISKTFLANHLKKNKYDIIITADKGLESLEKLDLTPNYIIGDFDSVNKTILNRYKKLSVDIKELLPEKDFTDTEAALDIAIKKKSTKITIIGATGTRLDHILANIHILKKALDKNVEARIINSNNEIMLIKNEKEILKDDKYKYISLIPLTTSVEGITLKGFKYEIQNYTLKIGTSLGVSNEQILPKAKITLKEGILIIIKSKD